MFNQNVSNMLWMIYVKGDKHTTNWSYTDLVWANDEVDWSYIRRYWHVTHKSKKSMSRISIKLIIHKSQNNNT